MKVELLDLKKLVPYARNPRITAHAVDKVAASIKEFGFRQPIVVDSEMVIIAGHTRYQAAQKLGLIDACLCMWRRVCPRKQVKAYRIADNRTGEEAQWDNEMLALELADLDNMSFDKAVLGFEAAELEQLQKSLDSLLTDGIDDDEEKPIDEADTRATIGPYSFEIPRERYLVWIEEVKQEVGFDKEAIVHELKKRLGL